MAFLLTPLLFFCLWATSAAAETLIIDPSNCDACHDPENWARIHLNVDHNATPPSGQVVIHSDTGHDDAGWYGTKSYFAVRWIAAPFKPAVSSTFTG